MIYKYKGRGFDSRWGIGFFFSEDFLVLLNIYL